MTNKYDIIIKKYDFGYDLNEVTWWNKLMNYNFEEILLQIFIEDYGQKVYDQEVNIFEYLL